MITSEEKAGEIINKHYEVDNCLMKAREHALITINEIIEQWDYIDTYIANLNGELSHNLQYYREVRKHLLLS